MKKIILPIALITVLLFAGCNTTGSDAENIMAYPIKSVAFNEVNINDSFWSPKLEIIRDITVPDLFDHCEKNGRLDDFLIAGRRLSAIRMKGNNPFEDTDVYKVIEGASYLLSLKHDPSLDAYLDSIISIISIGQEPDGYLTTWKTIDSTYSPVHYCPPGGRWQNLRCSHELYNSGHLFEAAAAHYLSTGKRNLFDIALKNADLLVSVFGDERIMDVPGHQIVETGLIRLFQITRNNAYLNLARQFLDLRGDSLKRVPRGEYSQDHKPVIDQDEAVGHAVRAVYMYAGMTDIAAIMNDDAYKTATYNIWNNIVNKKLYITGGLGARHRRESFGENYELPNLTAYNETCAAIGNVYWNHRMFLLHGDAQYIDILERSLYNGVISGIGIKGKTFFYPNPLECDMEFSFNKGALDRQPWFTTSCCPTNMGRFMPSVGNYIYARTNDKFYVNLFVASEADINMENNPVFIKQETNYPWHGDVSITVSPKKAKNYTMHIRIPGWARNRPVPGNLYSYASNQTSMPEIKVNGQPFDYDFEKGYAVIERKWQPGDVVTFSLPMQVQMVVCNENVVDNNGKIALERGPVVYCFEGIDNGDYLESMALNDNTFFEASFEKDLLGGVVTINGIDPLNENAFRIKAIPYYAWNNRGVNKMKVWIPAI
jgi:uncharacterized protein